MRYPVRRAVEKYGPQDWSRWRFRAEWVSHPAALRTMYFIWKHGELLRTGTR
jgi:hypothetical protein